MTKNILFLFLFFHKTAYNERFSFGKCFTIGILFCSTLVYGIKEFSFDFSKFSDKERNDFFDLVKSGKIEEFQIGGERVSPFLIEWNEIRGLLDQAKKSPFIDIAEVISVSSQSEVIRSEEDIKDTFFEFLARLNKKPKHYDPFAIID